MKKEKEHARRFSDAVEEGGSCCEKEIPPESLEGFDTEVR